MRSRLVGSVVLDTGIQGDPNGRPREVREGFLAEAVMNRTLGPHSIIFWGLQGARLEQSISSPEQAAGRA